jgi:hypothetical protein
VPGLVAAEQSAEAPGYVAADEGADLAPSLDVERQVAWSREGEAAAGEA